jgi:hypothetical protein
MLDPLRFEQLVDLGHGEGCIGSKIDARDLASVALHDRVEHILPAVGAVDIAGNPVKFGTGLPVKTIEALSYGKPIVATSAGWRDLEDFSDAISVADDPDTFTGRVLELLECKDTRLKISQRALAAASEWQRHQLIALDAAIIGQKPAYPKEAPIARDDEILYNPARKSNSS